ncbi:MAG: hypothetical protein WCX48_11585, partial [Bacteroidales bacterium]
MATKDKLFLVCIGLLVIVCLASLAWGFVLDYRLRNNADTRRVRSLEDTIIDLEKQLASGQGELDSAR